MIWDVVIVGGGPGGMQAAVAAASEGLKVLVLEKAKVGGQIGQTPRLENSIFANGGITGPELAAMMQLQADKMGVVVEQGEARELKAGRTFHKIGVGNRWLNARTVVLAMGNRWNDLGIPGMKDGIAAGTIHVGPVECLTAGVEGKDVAVFGGGPSAGQAIIELAGKAREVHVVLRSVFKMPKYLTDRIDDLPNVTIHKHTRIENLEASTLGVGIDVEAKALGHFRIDAAYLFSCNGLVPATDWLKGSGVKLDDQGRVVTHLPSLQTHVPGVWAIGDCRAGSTPRVGVAVGDGSMAVTELWNHFIKNPVCKDCKTIFEQAGVKV